MTELFFLLGTSQVKAQVPPQWDTAKVELTFKLNQINNEILNQVGTTNPIVQTLQEI